MACCGAPRSPSRTSANGASARVEIEGRGQQRLRGLAGRAGDDADGAAAPALVEQLHRAGRAFAGDFEPRDVVAQLDRQIERGFGFAVLPARSETCFADRRGLLVQRAHDAGVAPPPSARSTLTVIFAAAFSAATSASGRRCAAVNDGQRAVADGLAEACRRIPRRGRCRCRRTARRSRSRRWLSGSASMAGRVSTRSIA